MLLHGCAHLIIFPLSSKPSRLSVPRSLSQPPAPPPYAHVVHPTSCSFSRPLFLQPGYVVGAKQGNWLLRELKMELQQVTTPEVGAGRVNNTDTGGIAGGLASPIGKRDRLSGEGFTGQEDLTGWGGGGRRARGRPRPSILSKHRIENTQDVSHFAYCKKGVCGYNTISRLG